MAVRRRRKSHSRKRRHSAAGHKGLTRRVARLERHVKRIAKRVRKVEKKVGLRRAFVAGAAASAYGGRRRRSHSRAAGSRSRKRRHHSSAAYGDHRHYAARCFIVGPGHGRGSHVQCIDRHGHFVGARRKGRRSHGKRRAHAYA